MKMMRNSKRRCFLISVLVLVMLSGFTGNSQNELHTPYPIIFVHGLNGSNQTWDRTDYDIIDFLQEGTTPLKYGGIIDVCLDADRNAINLNSKKEDDVYIFPQHIFGDFYCINFDIHIKNQRYPNHSFHLLNPILSGDSDIQIAGESDFHIGDIIYIDKEFMQVTDVKFDLLGTMNLKVNRNILNTLANNYLLLPLKGWDLSNESNMASIAKQGLGLAKTIQTVKNNTGASKVILVCHSMGGLAAREYLQSDYYKNDVAKMVTIGTPHWGSDDFDIQQIASIVGIDPKSDAARDLASDIYYKENINTGSLSNTNKTLSHKGIYLFGGPENIIPNLNNTDISQNYYSKDVNSNGLETDIISGLNQFDLRHFPENVSRTWIASSVLGTGTDGVVATKRQYISSLDTIMTNTIHLNEGKDIYALIRGMDEPSDPKLAYEISEKSTNKGFITYQQNSFSNDVDLYKINISKRGLLNVSLTSIGNSINKFELLDQNMNLLQHQENVEQGKISYDVEQKLYYIKIESDAFYESWEMPYTLTTQFTETPPAILAVSQSSLQYYDVLLNTPKNKTITLTNNGSTNISISSIVLTGTNADQFSVAPLPPLLITPGTSLVETVTFNPTSTGLKSATLTINTNATENPSKIITLVGNGADHETKVLSSTPLTSYIFDNTKIGLDRSKNIIIKNTGSGSCTISAVVLEGLNKEDFSITSLPTVPFDIATGDTKQITLQFSPTSIGSKNASLAITNNSDNFSPKLAINLYGNGLENTYSGTNNTLTSYEYWYDNDYNTKTSTTVNSFGDFILDSQFNTDQLIIGLHSLHIRYKDKKGKWSSVISKYFYKPPNSKALPRKITTSEYWFDDDYSSNVSTPITPNNTASINIGLDVNALSDGLHSYHIRYKDDGGKWSSVISKFFYKLPVGTRNITSYRYWVNDNFSNVVYIDIDNPTQILDLSKNIDLSNNVDGDYAIHFQFKDSKGKWSSVLTNNFTLVVDDIIPPTVTTLAPTDDATGVFITSDFVLTFNENIQKGTGNILIKDASDDSTVQSIDVTGAEVSISNTVVTINPASNLIKSKSYYIQIPNTALTDMASTPNAYAGIADKTSWRFTTALKIAPTITFVDFSKAYGDANFDLSASSNSTGTISYSIISEGTGSVSLSGTNNSVVTLITAGTVTIRATQAADANYIADSKDITLTIIKATLTVTADTQTKVYGSPNRPLTLSYSGFVNSETATDLTTAPNVKSTAVTETTGVGTYTGDLVASGGVSANYTFSYVAGDFEVTKATLTVTAEDQTKVYDGDFYSPFTVTYNGFITGESATDLGGTLAYSGTATTAVNVGTNYVITPLGLTSSNYDLSFVAGKLDITQKALTITADAKSKAYGQVDPALTYQITSGALESGDAFSGSLTRAVGESVADYAITVGTVSAGANYLITYVGANLTITSAAIVATTNVATSITTDGAVLNGTVNDGGTQTTVVFEYGLTSDLSGSTTSTDASQSPLAANSGATSVSLTLTGLTDNTAYYFRVKGTNSAGTVSGSILSFKTSDSQLDDDGDGVLNDVDQCPNTPIGDVVDANGCTINAILGDSNGDLNVNVLDLVQDVNYILGRNPSPFVFEAADVNNDTFINVLDIVGTVDIILNPTSAKMASSQKEWEYYSKDPIGEALFYWEGDDLYVNSKQAISGMQLAFDKEFNYTIANDITKFDLLEFNKDATKTLMIYSFTDVSIEPGITKLLTKLESEAIILDAEKSVVGAPKGLKLTATFKNSEVLDVDSYNQSDSKNLILFSPNPNQGNLNIDFNLINGIDKVNIQAYNVQGVLVYSKNNFKINQGKSRVQIDLSKLPNGLYIFVVDVIQNGEIRDKVYKKIIKK